MSSAESGNFNFENKNAFVTGTSKGLGEQIALRLLERGVYVVGASRSDPPESIKQYIEQGQADYEQGDLMRDTEQVVSDIYKKHQGYEIFVNNAGAFSPDILTRQTPEKIQNDIMLDLVVPIFLHRSWYDLYNRHYPDARAPELSINICSISSIYSWGGGPAYQPAKRGLAALVYQRRQEQKYLLEQASADKKQQAGPIADLAARHVAIYPDNVATGLLSRAQQDSLYEVQGDALPTEIVVQTIIQAIEGQGNFGKYDDIAILANPNDPKIKRPLRGVYLAFLPIDEETRSPNFSNRILEKIADEDVLVKRG